MKIILETERLILREMSHDDFAAHKAVWGDNELMKHYPYTFDDERVSAWIERNIERYKNDGFGLWAVVLKESGEVIGDCGLTMQNIDGTMLPEVGYHIHRDYQKKGYASEAAKAVIDYAFSNYSFPYVYAYMKYSNVASYSTAMKCGMKFIKEYPDPANITTKVYGISREEWKNKQEKC